MNRPGITVIGKVYTRDQLEQVRREIARLHAHELTLTTTYGQREKRIDGLLDERLTAAGAPA
jgi:hypothetical protein